MLGRLPAPDPAADVRMWVDRRFVVHGAGTVVTGTLQQGAVAVGDTLLHGTDRVRVRGVQTLGREVDETYGVARVALRLGGSAPASLDRGSVLVTPGAWRPADVVDVRVTDGPAPPERPVLHAGGTALGCHYRPLGDGLGRLTLPEALPLRVGDRALLRDAGSRRLWGVHVLDPAPPSLHRRGAAAARAARLRSVGSAPDLGDELERRGWARLDLLRQIGVPTEGAGAVVQADGWLLDPARVDGLRDRLADLVAAHARDEPLSDGLPVGAAANGLGLPTHDLVPAVLPHGSRVRDGRIVSTTASRLPGALRSALAQLAADLRDNPFRAPEAARLAELGLDRRAVAAAEKAALVLRVTDTVVLLPGADREAAGMLGDLPQPFTLSQARERLGTTRRVAVPLLELLDRQGLTTRLPDDRREVRMPSAPGG
jgi:selenocysteine-specific elongation factor